MTSGAARPSANIDPEQPVFDLDRIGPQPHGRVGQAARATQVEAKTVPRTGHGRPFEPAPAQGAALVGAPQIQEVMTYGIWHRRL